MMKIRKLISVFLMIVMLISNLTLLTSAQGYVVLGENLRNEENNEGIQPLYDIIHSVKMYATEEKLTAIVEADDYCSLRVTITLYQENGSGWSFLAKKTFSDYSTALLGSIYYDFEPGVTYRGVANFYAGGETDTMDETFSF